MAKKALIYGISGQDGAYLAQLLLEKGYEVFGTSRDANLTSFSGLEKLGIKDKVTLISAQLRDFRSVYNSLTKVQPDEVYNLAAQSSVGLSFEMPIETFESIAISTLNLLEGIRIVNRKIKLYNASSSECFGDTITRATDETPFNPRSPYAIAKAAAHFQIKNYREAYNLFSCSGILFNHESSLRPERFVTQKIIKAAIRIQNGSDEKLKIGNIKIKRDWGWAPDYVEAMWKMLQIDEAQDFVIATGKTHSLEEFTAMAFEELGLNWADHTEVSSEFFRPTDIAANYADPSKAEKILGWKASKDLRQVIAQIIKDNE
jgi:GDPmannose 4,6-dehydratase